MFIFALCPLLFVGVSKSLVINNIFMRKLILSLLALGMFLVSCQQLENLNQKDVISIDKSLLEQVVPANATAVADLSFTVSKDWTASSDAAWLTINPNHGSAGNATIHIALEANTSTTERLAKVKITCGEFSVEARITQQAAQSEPEPEPEPQPQPTYKKYVKSIGMRYVENYPAESPIGGGTFSLSYDESNRVTKVVSTNCTTTFDYSKSGTIVIESTDQYNPSATCTIGPDGLVSRVEAGEETYVAELQDGYVSKFSLLANGVFRTGYSIKHDGGKVTQFVYSDSYGTQQSFDVPYKYNIATTNINVDLNWLAFSGWPNGVLSMVWLGFMGPLGNTLIEVPTMYSKSSRGGGPSVPPGTPQGTYHYEVKFNRVDMTPGDIAVAVSDDNDGCPVTLTYSHKVKEWKYSFDYTVIDNNGNWHFVDGTSQEAPTGNVLGTNDIVIEIQYK